MNNIDIGLNDAREQVVDLSKELLVLRLAFGKLKATARDAFAPITVALTEGLQQATFAATRLIKKVGAVIAALFGVKVAQDKVTKAVAATGRAARRSLAGFDQLERLNGGSGGSAAVTASASSIQLTPELSAIAEKLRALLAPLQAIDLTPLRFTLARLGESFRALAQTIGTALEWAWYTVLTPFVAWVAERLAPLFTMTLKAALDTVTAALSPLGAGFGALMTAMQPVFAFLGSTVQTALAAVRTRMEQLGAAVTEKGAAITGIFQNIGQVITGLWQLVAPILGELRFQWSQTFQEIGAVTARVRGFVVDGLYAVTEVLAGVFTGDWKRAWDGVVTACKAGVNLVIGLLNRLLSALTGAVNGVVRTVNKLRFTAPDWVPGIGGKAFGFQLKTVTTPQIPYLAKGAVLPANRPFLAMVGDQRHGTNVETPLSVIQDAVAQVLGDRLDGMMAGFDATVEELRRLHDTVSAIEVGDAVIGKAAARYQQKMAVVHGRSY